MISLFASFLFKHYNQAGSDNQILAGLEDFGLGEEHGRAVYGGRLRSIKLHREWLGKRQVIEQERENQENRD
jgi:hypothetical protein